MAKKEIKTDSLILEPGTLPSVGVEGELRVDSADSNKLKKYDSASTSWKISGGTGGSGGINYIDNPDAESSITGWVLYEDAAGSVPVNGTGVAVFNEITFGRNTSSPLRDLADFLITKDGANRQGEGVSYDFTIDSADQAKIMRISFDYKTSAAYVDNDIGVYIYDVTNSQLIYPVDANLKASTLAKQFIAEFQTNSNSVAYRLIFHIASVNASAYTVNLDNVQVGPRELAKGSVVTDWQSYTPTIAAITSGTPARGSGAVENSRWRRVGDSMEIQYDYEHTGVGTAASGTYTWSLPTGYSIDTTKLTPTTGGVNPLGTFYAYNGSTEYMGYLSPRTSTALQGIIFTSISSAGFAGSSNISFGNATLRVKFQVLVPILGWSSNVVISSDFGSRIIASRYLTNSANSLLNTTTTIIDFEDKDFDLTSSVTTGASWKYTAPETGYYQVNTAMQITGGPTWVAGNEAVLYLYKNGALYSTLGGQGAEATVSSNTVYLGGCDMLKLNAGDYVDLRVWQNSGDTASLYTGASGAGNYISVNKIQSPQTLMAQELVSACYTLATTQTVATGTNKFLDFETKQWDTHNAVVGAGSGVNATYTSTWRYVAPYSGKYEISCKVLMASAAWNATTFKQLAVAVDGTNIYNAYEEQEATLTFFAGFPQLSTTVSVNAGQAISIRLNHNQGSDRSTLNDGTYNRVVIKKVN